MSSTGALRVALLATLGAVPGVVLLGVVDGTATVAVSAIVAVVAACTGSLVAERRPVALAALVGLAGAIASASAAAIFAPSPSNRPGWLAATSDGAVYGWSTLITSPVPADPNPRIFVPLVVVVWTSTFVAVLLTRSTRSTRPNGPIASLSPCLAAIFGAVVAAGREQYRPVVVGAVCAVVVAAFVATFRSRVTAEAARRRGMLRPGRRRTAAALAATVTLSVAAGAVVAPSIVDGRHPFDPRDRIDPVILPSDATNPLELFASRQLAGATPLFTVRSPEPLLTRVIALERYDGARWTTAAGYEPSGTVVDAPERSGVTTRDVTIDVEVEALTGPWLPLAGDVRRIEGLEVRIEPESGTAITTAGDVAGATYRFDASLVAADLRELPALSTASDPVAIAATAIPPAMPASLIEMGRVATQGATTPFAQAVLLERYLQLNFDRDELVTSGHSFGHLTTALLENGAGTDEQFAAAFAVLGRSLGLPTRVVVGFGPGAADGAGTYVVRSGDARVWPEVKFAGAGWIAFDPSPARDDQTTPIAIGPGGDGGFAITEADALPELAADRPPPVRITPPEPVNWGRRAAWFGGIVGVIGALGAAVIVILKRMRTRRRRGDGSANDRAVGAWADVLERLAEIDRADPRSRTVEQLVDDTEVTTSSLTGLYRPVSRALYDRRPCTDHDADQAWRARDRFVRAARRDAGPIRAVWWAVDPRPLITDARRRIADARHGEEATR